MRVDITNIPFKMDFGEDFFLGLAEEIKAKRVDTIYSFDYKKGLQNLAVFAKGGPFKDRVEIVIKTRLGNEIRIFLKVILGGEEALYVKIVDPKEHQAIRTAFLNGADRRMESATSIIKQVLGSS